MPKVKTLHRVQTLPISLQEAWRFFSDPMNLAEITPKDMGFTILSEPPKSIYPGLMLHYHVRALPFLKVEWVTEITVVRELEFFVDEQRTGPYRLWHHEHRFRQIPGGVEMDDLVHYALPFGWVGSLLAGSWVEKQLTRIFDYRKRAMEARFSMA